MNNTIRIVPLCGLLILGAYTIGISYAAGIIISNKSNECSKSVVIDREALCMM